MNEPVRPPASPARPTESPARGELPGASRPPRAGEPAPPGSFDGRARSFRERQEKRRSARRERIGQLLVVLIVVLGVYAVVTARPYNPSSTSSLPTPGPPITVSLGTPVASTVTCGAGGTAYAERIVWENSTAPVTTGDITVRVYEIYDGDFVPDQGVVANVTPSNLCAGSPPSSPPPLWYVVMAAPNGTTLLSYTVTQGWTSVTSGPWNFQIENGSAMTVVTGVSLAGTGHGFAVVGFAGGSPIRGSVPL